MIFIPKMSHKSSLVKKEFATDDRVSEDAFPLPVSDDCCPIASTSADGRFLASSQWLFRQPRTLPPAHQNRSFAAAKAGKGAGRTAAEHIHYYSIIMTKQVFHTNAKNALKQYISRRFLSGKKASNRIWVFFDTFKRHFTSILLFLRTFPNRSDHCIFLGSISWGSSKGSKRTLKAVRRVS